MEARDSCDITISIDCDGQDDIDAMDYMVDAYLEGNEVVYGVRSKRDTDTFFKRFTAEGFYKLLNWMGAEVVFNHADYRLVSSRVLRELAKFKEVNLFLRGMVPLVGFKSTSVYYERHERVAGESHYPLRKRFYSIHPIVIFDTDDWTYAYRHRDAVPLWNAWNPARVFPEVFMPLASTIGVYVFYPIMGDFFASLTLSYAMFTAASMTALVYAVHRKFDRSNMGDSLLLIVYFFVIAHFWIFRTSESGNNYMLKSADACTYFYYVIPNLLNAAAVLWYSMDEGLHGSKILGKWKKGAAFVFVVYFCIFSNIWAGVIMGAYIGAVLSYDLIFDVLKKEFRLREYCRGLLHKG